MNSFFKGCLIIFAILFGLVIIGFVAVYFYWQTPNKINFTNSPIKKEKYLKTLSFKNKQFPDFILNQNEKNILYQAYIEDEGIDMTVIYKVVIKLNKDIVLVNSLPLNPSEKEKINDKITFNKIDDNGFNPQIKIPEDNETQSGSHLNIFSQAQQSQTFLTLKKGGYSYSHNEIDKDGYVTDIIIYDKKSKLLYFERQRYYAFQ